MKPRSFHTTCVHERLGRLAAGALAIVLVASATSMVLWCHAFERLLYAYKLMIPMAAYKMIRAYGPFGLAALACMVLVRRSRLRAMFVVAGLGAAGVALHVGVFVRGASGCCGPHVSTTLVAAGMVYSLLMLALAITGIRWTPENRGAVRVGSVAALLVVSLLAAGCSRNDSERPAQRAADRMTRTAYVDAVEKRMETDQLAAHPHSNEARALTDAILKGMDDLSAALGLQYARFSYDPARKLADYTNALMTIGLDELRDFLQDYTRARGGYPSNEVSLLREMLIAYMTNTAREGWAERIDALASTLGETYLMDSGASMDSCVACMNELATLRMEFEDGMAGAVYVATALANCAHGMIVRDVMADKAAPVYGGSCIERLLAMPELDAGERARLLLVRAGLCAAADTQQARRDYAMAFDLAPGDDVKLNHYGAWVLYQGLQQGLEGKALFAFANEKARAFWKKREDHAPLRELLNELHNQQ